MEPTPPPAVPDQPAQPEPLPNDQHSASPAIDFGQLASEVYPQPTPVVQPPNGTGQIRLNPLTNMANGFMKFAKTNLLPAVVYFILGVIYTSVVLRFVFEKLGGSISRDLIVFAIYYIVSLLLGSVLLLSWSKLLVEGVRRQKLSLKQSLQAAKKAWVLIIYYLVMTLLCFLYFGAVVTLDRSGGAGSSIASVVGGLVCLSVLLIVSLRWSFGLFTIVDYDDSGPLNSLSRSSELTRGHRWLLLGYWLIIIFAMFIIGAASGGFHQTASHPSLQCPLTVSGDPTCVAPASTLPSDILTIGLSVVETLLVLIFYSGLAELYRQLKDGMIQPAHAFTAAPASVGPVEPILVQPPPPEAGPP